MDRYLISYYELDYAIKFLEMLSFKKLFFIYILSLNAYLFDWTQCKWDYNV